MTFRPVASNTVLHLTYSERVTVLKTNGQLPPFSTMNAASRVSMNTKGVKTTMPMMLRLASREPFPPHVLHSTCTTPDINIQRTRPKGMY